MRITKNLEGQELLGFHLFIVNKVMMKAMMLLEQ